MSYPRYPEYKDSGVEWLGEVPAHWTVTVLKRGFNVTLGKMLQPDSNGPEDELLPYLRAANIQWNGVDSTDIKQMWLSKRDRAQLRLERDDLLVSEGGDVGRSCMWASELEFCYFQNSVNRVRARDGHSNRYLYYWISAIKDKGFIDVLCNKSTIAHFTAEKVAAVPIPLPTQQEQSHIATFLDREMAKTDALVAEQQRLMDLLKEKRQAVISHAVTKGLNPDAPMKPSGIDWLGDVPAHWLIAKSLRYFKVAMGQTILREDLIDDGEWPVFSATDGDHYFGYVNDPKVRLGVGDIVIPARGNSIGAVKLVKEPSTTTQTTIYCKNLSNGQLSPSFIFYFFKGCRDNLFYFTQTAIPQITVEEVGSNPVLIPPGTEQLRIADFLDSKIAIYDALTTETQLAIDLLQERRTALISAAVTGQIDVRGTSHSP